MFDFVHRHKRVVQIVLAFMTVPFAIWGIESYTRSRGGADTVATVNGLTVTQRDFESELRRQQEQMRRMFGRNFDPAMLERPEAKRAVLDSLVTQRVVASAAVKGNLTITDEMLAELIHSIPAFQSEGRFSKAQYEVALRSQSPPMSSAQFEARLRHDMTIQQLTRAVGESAIAPRTVGERLVALEGQKREISEVRIGADQFRGQASVEDGKLKAYYDANPDEFKVPERVRAEYVMLSGDALARLEPVTEAEVTAAYDARAAEFKVPEQRRASHILVKTREEADKILAEVKKNPGRFAEVAKKQSEDTGSAAKGGDLEWFSSGMMVKPFEDAVFAMKKEGEIAGPVQSEFGFHVIRLTGIKPGKARPLEDVRKALTADVARQKGSRKFAESAEAFNNLVYEQSDSLKPAAERFKLQLQTTPWVARSGSQQAAPLDNPKLLSALFSQDSIKNKRNTDAVEVAPGTLVAARVVEYQPVSQRSFDDVKKNIADRLLRQQAVELAQKDGEAKLEQLRKGADAGVKWGAPRTVSRRDPQGLPRELLQPIVAADVSKLPAYVGVPVPNAGYLLIRIGKIIEADPKDPKEQSTESRARVNQLFGSAQYDAYVESLRSRADIEIKPENLEKK
jgi:peptidyl-prolyl cis-trans isomerase D